MSERITFITQASLLAVAEGQWITKHGKLNGTTIEEMLKEANLYEKYMSCPIYRD